MKEISSKCVKTRSGLRCTVFSRLSAYCLLQNDKIMFLFLSKLKWYERNYFKMRKNMKLFSINSFFQTQCILPTAKFTKLCTHTHTKPAFFRVLTLSFVSIVLQVCPRPNYNFYVHKVSCLYSCITVDRILSLPSIISRAHPSDRIIFV